MTAEDGQPVLVQNVKAAWHERLRDKALDQSPLAIVLGIACYVLYSTLMESIPVHIKTINDNYTKLAVEDREARRDDAKTHLEAVKAVVANNQASQDLMERVLTGKINAIHRQVDENASKLQDIKQ